MIRDDDLFGEALALPPAERSAFLAHACAGDHARRVAIEELLALAGESHGFLEKNTVGCTPATPEEKPSDKIGRYKLLEKIGEGGCGVVWMAEQSEPVRRRVALKVIKLGMDTREVIARFEAERQVLALMDHPNIAKVHDGGATEAGRPFFVMELVRGLPITRYCDEQKLKPMQRIELFIKVCQAVQHAHQKGIIHRDLKPSNILVIVNDGVATPKVIDFGIAKATQGPLTDKTLFTAFAQFIGTPAYMSPEQADLSSVDIDTRSDIYSLGVLFYELLAGQPPFDAKAFAQAGLDEIRRQIRDIEPPKPSTRLSTQSDEGRATIARQRGTAPAQLSLLLRGDLDWIVMRCLEKDRARRYETANALAMDLRRHLAHEPVVARPPSTAYLLGRLVRRHRFGFAAASAVAAVLLIGAAVSTWQAVRATRAEHSATRAEHTATRAAAEQGRLRAVAEKAQVAEAAQRTRAEAQELAARRRAYAADTNLVQQMLAVDNLGRAQELLDRQRPKPGELDLRGWEWRYLWQYCRSDAESVLVEPDANSINSLAVSPDGQWLAIGKRFEGALHLRNLRMQETLRLRAGNGDVRAAFSPDGRTLAVGMTGLAPAFAPDSPAGTKPNNDARVVLWDITARHTTHVLPLNGQCYGLSFSSDGKKLVVAANLPPADVSVWRTADGAKLAEYPIGDPEVPFVCRFATAPDASFAVTSTTRGLQVTDLATGAAQWSARTVGLCRPFACSPDGMLIASGTGGGDEPVIQLWDAATGREVRVLRGHKGSISDLIFTPDGKRLVSCSTDQTIRIWDPTSDAPPRVLRGHTTEVWRLALMPDGKTLVSGSKDGSVVTWNLAAEPPNMGAGRIADVRNPSLWEIADGGASIINRDRGNRLVRHRGRDFRDEEVLLDLGPISWAIIDGWRPRVATSTTGSRVAVRDWTRGVVVAEFDAGLEGQGWWLRMGRFSADGTRLAASFAHSQQNTLAFREWDVATGHLERSFDFRRASGWKLATSADLSVQYLVNGNWGENTLRLNLEGGGTAPLQLSVIEPRATALSPDKRWLAVTSLQSFVRIFDAATGEPAMTLGGYMFGVHSAGYFKDGSRLAVGSTRHEAVTIWDLVGRHRLLTLGTDSNLIDQVRLSPDEDLVVVREGSDRGLLFWWRAPSWAEIEVAEKKLTRP